VAEKLKTKFQRETTFIANKHRNL